MGMTLTDVKDIIKNNMGLLDEDLSSNPEKM